MRAVNGLHYGGGEITKRRGQSSPPPHVPPSPHPTGAPLMITWFLHSHGVASVHMCAASYPPLVLKHVGAAFKLLDLYFFFFFFPLVEQELIVFEKRTSWAARANSDRRKNRGVDGASGGKII